MIVWSRCFISAFSCSLNAIVRLYSLECQIQADIAPHTVQWQFNGQELIQSDRVETGFIEDVGLSHLTVRQASPSDSGEYACKVVGEVIEPKTGERTVKTIISSADVAISGKLDRMTYNILWCVRLIGTNHCPSLLRQRKSLKKRKKLWKSQSSKRLNSNL